MPLSTRAPALLRQSRRFTVTLPKRPLTLSASTSFSPAQRAHQKRSFVRSAVRASVAAAQPAPNPKAYLESGVIKPREHVNVKKVLVIGSGGLAIGQAGEFDYSGS